MIHRSAAVALILSALMLTGGASPARAQPGPAGSSSDAAAATDSQADGLLQEEQRAGDKPADLAAAGAVEVDLSSPEATVFTFLRAMARVNDGYDQAWGAALATFSNLTDADTQTRRDRARALLAVFDRLGEIKREYLPSAQELAEAAEDENPPLKRWRFFPGPEHEWVFDEIQERTGGAVREPAGVIVLATGEDGRWRFNEQTLAQIEALRESLAALPIRHARPTAETGQIDPTELIGLLGPTYEKTDFWRWGALLGCIFAGVVLGKGASVALRRVAASLHKRSWGVRGVVFDDAAGPANLALTAAGLMVGLRFIFMHEDLSLFSWKVIQLLYIVSLGWFLFNLVDVIEAALQKVTAKTDTRLDDMVVPLIRKTLRIFLLVVFALFIGQNIFGFNITGFLAGLGIAGLAISLAAQDSVKNLFGSLTVFFDKPFMVGDFIVFDNEMGTVEEIGFRSTRIRLLSGHLVTVPNMKFIDNKVENISARPYIRRELDVTITYDTPPQKIQEALDILRQVLTEDREVVGQGRFDLENRGPKISFSGFNADSLNLKAYYWYQIDHDPDRGWFTYLEHCGVVNQKLFERYGEAGIDFAFPTQTLYLAGDPSRELSVRVVSDQQGRPQIES